MTTTLTRPPTGASGSPPPGVAQPGRTAPPLPGLAELALTLLTLAAAVDLGRLFRSPAPFLVPVCATAVAVHLVCWETRRRGQSLAVAALASIVVTIFVLSWTVLGRHTTLGFPTRATASAARHAVSAAMHQFRTASAPAPTAPGWALAGGAGCGLVAFLGDWAAFRMRATVEACLPSLSLFVFSAALAQGHRTTLAAAVWLSAVLLFLLVREAGVERPGPAWFASRSGRGPSAVLQAGAFLLVGTVLAATVVGPHLPGATSRAIVNWRHQSGTGAGRTTVSPLVDIRARITQEPDVEVFTVSANAPAYWRLTALDTFDGNGWSLNDTYRHQGSALGDPVPDGTMVDAHFAISNLDSIWLPAAFRPVHYHGPGRVSYSSSAGSLVSDRSTADGLSYEVVSSLPVPPPALLRTAPFASPTDPVVAHELDLPAGIPADVFATARRVTRAAQNPYDRALMLQNFFRANFTYDLNVPAEDGENAIEAFLRDRRGFCQQFAGTFAVMARMLGLPTRVAVGFTPGVASADGQYHVRDEHAHAWPEVWFAGVGWVAFEPTPGRGAPNAQGYTGVRPQQATDTGGTGTGTGGTTPTTAGTTTATTAPSVKPGVAAHGTRPKASHHTSGVVASATRVLRTWWPLAVLIGLLSLTPAVREARRRQRRAAARTPDARVLLAWKEAGEQLATIGARARPSDTPTEFAHRVGAATVLAPDARAAVADLADRVIEASYSAQSTSEETATGAEGDRSVIARAVSAARPWWQRAARELDPRALVGRD